MTYNQPTLGYRPVKPYMPADLRATLSFAGIDPDTVIEWQVWQDNVIVRVGPQTDHVNIKVKPVTQEH